MADFYKSSAGKSYLADKEKNQKKCHRCIAALICDPHKEDPFVAVLCTGTKYNEAKCYSMQDGSKNHKDSPCDGHAESLCIEAAPIFFQNEMQRCLEGEISIFEFKNTFVLKPNIEFHLLITEPPCGWIQDRQSPCMGWKPNFIQTLHIPTCSARILINSKLGIQGYLSHLLDKCIFIQSVIILCTEEEDHKFCFPLTVFDLNLPTITTIKYDPSEFNPNKKCITYEPMNLGQREEKSSLSTNKSNQNGSKDGKGENIEKNLAVKHSHVAIDQYKRQKSFVINCTYNVHETKVRDHNEPCEKHYSILERKIDDNLSNKVSKDIQIKRKLEMKDMYDALRKKLNLQEVLEKRHSECTKYKASKEHDIKKKALPAEHRVEDKTEHRVDDKTEHRVDDKIDPGTECKTNHQAEHMTEYEAAICKTASLSITDMFCKGVQELLNEECKCPKQWIATINKVKKKMEGLEPDATRLIDAQNMIKDIEKLIENPSDCILDCSWKRYFDELLP